MFKTFELIFIIFLDQQKGHRADGYSIIDMNRYTFVGTYEILTIIVDTNFVLFASPMYISHFFLYKMLA